MGELEAFQYLSEGHEPVFSANVHARALRVTRSLTPFASALPANVHARALRVTLCLETRSLRSVTPNP
jgi:hypothetical protein